MEKYNRILQKKKSTKAKGIIDCKPLIKILGTVFVKFYMVAASGCTEVESFYFLSLKLIKLTKKLKK